MTTYRADPIALAADSLTTDWEPDIVGRGAWRLPLIVVVTILTLALVWVVLR